MCRRSPLRGAMEQDLDSSRWERRKWRVLVLSFSQSVIYLDSEQNWEIDRASLVQSRLVMVGWVAGNFKIPLYPVLPHDAPTPMLSSDVLFTRLHQPLAQPGAQPTESKTVTYYCSGLLDLHRYSTMGRRNLTYPTT